MTLRDFNAARACCCAVIGPAAAPVELAPASLPRPEVAAESPVAPWFSGFVSVGLWHATISRVSAAMDKAWNNFISSDLLCFGHPAYGDGRAPRKLRAF